MAAYYPLFDDEMKEGPIGPPGIGFKLTDNGNYDMEKKKLKNVDEPVDISDVATKSYVDSNKIELKSDIVKLQKRSLIHSEHGDFDARNKIIGNVKDPINNLNVVNKQYLENNALTLSQKNTIPIEKFYNVNNIPLKNLPNPQDKNDAVHKQYVDKKTKINDKKPDNMLTKDHDGLYVPNETFLATQEYIMHTYPASFEIVFNKFTSLLLTPDLRLKTDMLMKITFHLRKLDYNPFISILLMNDEFIETLYHGRIDELNPINHITYGKMGSHFQINLSFDNKEQTRDLLLKAYFYVEKLSDFDL
ncbi:uncharacterized protein CDAR_215251 [Caerostris darwini]|uniref:Uncharacterized protein n=1 Tax=Caerostris darwini TaxID=1538125 RepID=A0AAV4QG18_9ARAC|nr:uncharacterized protein CDAR_215251 [Caerostris darwini]